MQGLGSTQPRAPPRSQLLGRRSCQRATQGRASAPLTTAFSTPPATPEGCARPVPLVKSGFPRGSGSFPTLRHRDPKVPDAPQARKYFTIYQTSPQQQQSRLASGGEEGPPNPQRSGLPNANPKWEEPDTQSSHYLAESPLVGHPTGSTPQEALRAYPRQRGGAQLRRLPIGCQSSRLVSRSLAGPMGILAVERPALQEWWRSCFLW